MSNEEIRRRLEQLRKEFIEAYGSSASGAFHAMRISGGLVPYAVIAIDNTGAEWIRDMAGGETEDAFRERAERASRASGATRCVTGGMPLPSASAEMQAAMTAASDHYFEFEYEDVPAVAERPAPVMSPVRRKLGY